jgi:hypothetical protein
MVLLWERSTLSETAQLHVFSHLSTFYANRPSQIETNIINHLLELVETSDKNHDSRIDYPEWEAMGESVSEDRLERLQ